MQDNSLQTSEVVPAATTAPLVSASSDSSTALPPAPPTATDVVFEAPIFSVESGEQSATPEDTPMILSQEVVIDTPIVASSSADVVFTPATDTNPDENIAVFEPIVAAPRTEPEIIPAPVMETLTPVVEMSTTSLIETKTESSPNVRNPEDILDDTERLLRQSEQALEDQAKILEKEAALHQEKANNEKEAADSALQAAQSAHAKADKLEATIANIQKEKEKLSVSA